MTIKSTITAACALFALAVLTTPAHAQISEVRAGITEYDAETIVAGWAAVAGRENSVAVNAEIIFDKFGNSQSPWIPRPYVGGMVNLAGDTSYIGAGLTWRADFSDKFYGDFGIGAVLHDGTKWIFTQENLREEGFVALLARTDEEVSYGSRYLFKPQLTLGYRLDERWAVEVFGEHMSNANTATVNEGVDSFGLRVARRF